MIKNIKEDDYLFLTYIETTVGCDYVLTLNQQISLRKLQGGSSFWLKKLLWLA